MACKEIHSSPLYLGFLHQFIRIFVFDHTLPIPAIVMIGGAISTANFLVYINITQVLLIHFPCHHQDVLIRFLQQHNFATLSLHAYLIGTFRSIFSLILVFSSWSSVIVVMIRFSVFIVIIIVSSSS